MDSVFIIYIFLILLRSFWDGFRFAQFSIIHSFEGEKNMATKDLKSPESINKTKILKIVLSFVSAVLAIVCAELIASKSGKLFNIHCPQLKHFLSTAEYQKIQT